MKTNSGKNVDSIRKEIRAKTVELMNMYMSQDIIDSMKNLKENSKWHQEESVYEHTLMVCEEYALRSNNKVSMNDLGFVACMWHDVGKPAVHNVGINEGTNRFAGHEKASSAIFFEECCYDYSNGDTFKIMWMIQHHLPYGRNKSMYDLFKMINMLKIEDYYFKMLYADALGRITEDHRIDKIDDIVTKFKHTNFYVLTTPDKKKTLYILSGLPASGKSTVTDFLRCSLSDKNLGVYNLDSLRMLYAKTDNYREAYNFCVENGKGFHKFCDDYLVDIRDNCDVIISDNTNITKRSLNIFFSKFKLEDWNCMYMPIMTDVSTCIKRDVMYRNSKVGADVIHKMSDTWWLPVHKHIDRVIFDD